MANDVDNDINEKLDVDVFDDNVDVDDDEDDVMIMEIMLLLLMLMMLKFRMIILMLKLMMMWTAFENSFLVQHCYYVCGVKLTCDAVHFFICGLRDDVC